MKKHAMLLILWTALLVAGFGLVLGLGGPLPNSEAVQAQILSPEPPVDEDEARAAAAAVIEHDYPGFIGIESVVDKRSQYGIERWVVIYTDRERAAGVRVSIDVKTAKLTVSTFP